MKLSPDNSVMTQVSTSTILDGCVEECVLRIETNEEIPNLYHEFRSAESLSTRDRIAEDIHNGILIALNYVVDNSTEGTPTFYQVQDVDYIKGGKLLEAVAAACFVLATKLFDARGLQTETDSFLYVVTSFIQGTFKYCLHSGKTYNAHDVSLALHRAQIL